MDRIAELQKKITKLQKDVDEQKKILANAKCELAKAQSYFALFTLDTNMMNQATVEMNEALALIKSATRIDRESSSDDSSGESLGEFSLDKIKELASEDSLDAELREQELKLRDLFGNILEKHA